MRFGLPGVRRFHPRDRVRQPDDRLRYAGTGRLFNEWHAVVAGLDHRPIVVRDLPKNIPADRLLGLFQTEAGPFYVSSGVGWFVFNIRFRCRPEIVVFEI